MILNERQFWFNFFPRGLFYKSHSEMEMGTMSYIEDQWEDFHINIQFIKETTSKDVRP